MFGYFEDHGYGITCLQKGIYYIEGNTLFPTQIVVTGELDNTAHIWLRALTEKMGKAEMRGLLDKIRNLKGKADREFADSVLEVSVGANKKIIEELKGDVDMCRALMEIMEP